MWRRILYAALVLGTLICFAPVGAVIWSSWFANRHGCTLHEGYVNPCVVNGTDYGETLYSAFVSGWFMLLTLPVGLILLGVLIALALLDWLNRRKRHSTTTPPS